MSDRLDHAIALALRGWRVFPLHSVRTDGRCSCSQTACRQIAKHPRTEHGLHDATASPSAVAAWWIRWPDANIGLPTGEAFTALDVDPKAGGDEALRSLEALHGPLPPTWRVLTGGGGVTPTSSRSRG